MIVVGFLLVRSLGSVRMHPPSADRFRYTLWVSIHDHESSCAQAVLVGLGTSPTYSGPEARFKCTSLSRWVQKTHPDRVRVSLRARHTTSFSTGSVRNGGPRRCSQNAQAYSLLTSLEGGLRRCSHARQNARRFLGVSEFRDSKG